VRGAAGGPLFEAAGVRLLPHPERLVAEALHVLRRRGWVAVFIGTETAEALKVEARRRSATKVWFEHITFASVLSRKPA
jgi:hypothetical protein